MVDGSLLCRLGRTEGSMSPCAILIFPITDAHGTVFRPAGAGSAVESRVAVFIKDAVVVGLLEGVEVTLIISVAFGDAVLEVHVVESIHIVSLAFVTGVAVPCWAPILTRDAGGAWSLGRISQESTVLECDAKAELSLIGPPVAFRIFRAKCVAVLRIGAHLKIHGIFLALPIYVAGHLFRYIPIIARVGWGCHNSVSRACDISRAKDIPRASDIPRHKARARVNSFETP